MHLSKKMVCSEDVSLEKIFLNVLPYQFTQFVSTLKRSRQLHSSIPIWVVIALVICKLNQFLLCNSRFPIEHNILNWVAGSFSHCLGRKVKIKKIALGQPFPHYGPCSGIFDLPSKLGGEAYRQIVIAGAWPCIGTHDNYLRMIAINFQLLRDVVDHTSDCLQILFSLSFNLRDTKTLTIKNYHLRRLFVDVQIGFCPLTTNLRHLFVNFFALSPPKRADFAESRVSGANQPQSFSSETPRKGNSCTHYFFLVD